MLQAHVSAAKAGVDALFRVAAVEYGPFGVRFNVIAPGPIAGTEGMARLAGSDPTIVGNLTKMIPLGRYGKISEIADASLFLFSPAASYVTGQVLIVSCFETMVEQSLIDSFSGRWWRLSYFFDWISRSLSRFPTRRIQG